MHQAYNHRKPSLAASAAGRLNSNPDEPEPPFSKRLTSLKLSDDGQAGDTARAATSDEVKDLRREATALKEVVADLTLENRLLKKSMSGDGEDGA